VGLEDAVGRHDTTGCYCSKESNRLRYGVKDTPNCCDNFLAALRPSELEKRDLVANINFFPQKRNPCNGYNPTPIRVVVWRP
jgi:uncharacterized protein YcgI (DUF1989 family)